MKILGIFLFTCFFMTDIPTVEQYQNAIANALSQRQIETLQILYFFPYATTLALVGVPANEPCKHKGYPQIEVSLTL